MYTSNSFFFFDNVNNEGYISMSIAILFINEKKICENLATTYSFWRQENIWYSQWNKGNVTTLLHIEEKVLVVFSTSRSIWINWGSKTGWAESDYSNKRETQCQVHKGTCLMYSGTSRWMWLKWSEQGEEWGDVKAGKRPRDRLRWAS